ncbi:SDR family NAD(P)-dependent oxidoreductase [Arcanobacterium wilhelmae]|uniref:SDR family NAD(P)-dependent oxidoreductase n=1 Tax=Arcanobacterium wilhelmae TaxID=1803177 RepID=UPI0024153124|nr:SDR family oxidoreductase [Arcanobacterium wilhelmae]WFN91059.1 SDR family NAD(P)-dependent oxidoreductase [Arcanobacterium wilhelmae]
MARSSEVIVLTGASRGIGAAIANAIAAPGRTLLLVARSIASLENTAQAARGLGATVHTYAAELSDVSSVNSLVVHIAADGFVPDTVINNAGVMGAELAPWEDDPVAWWRVLEVNVRAPFLLAHAFVPAMLEAGFGRIIDLSSGAAVWDTSNTVAYFVSKTALYRLGSSMHEAGYERGLRVLEVAPGVVKTDMTADAQMHVGRTEWNEPTEVAEIIAAAVDGDLDGLSGAQVRAGTDSLEDLRARSAAGIGVEERRLRMTPFKTENE